MAVAPLIQNRPKLVQLTNGRIVALSPDGALPSPNVAAGAGAPVTAGADNVIPLASDAQAGVETRKGKGGAANAGTIITGGLDNLKPIQAPEDDFSGIAALAKGLGKAAGISGGGSNSAPGSPGNTGSGFMDKVRDFLGIGTGGPTSTDTTGVKIPAPAPVQTDVLPPIPADPATTPGTLPPPPPASVADAVPQPAAALPPSDIAAAAPAIAVEKPGLFQRIGNALGISSPSSGGGALPDGANPAQSSGGFLDGIIDHGDPLMKGEQGDVMKARYGDNYHSPDWFERLQSNPARMSLLTGGLATMAAAGRPGASAGGAIGQGALTGLNTIYGQRAQQVEQGLAARKEASEESLRDAQGAFYGIRGDTAKQTADVNADYKGALGDAATQRAENDKVKADAALLKAKQAADGSKNPTALMKNAQFYKDSGLAPDMATAIGMVRQAVNNPAQRASLVTARTRMLLSTNLNPTDADVTEATIKARAQVNQEMTDASPAATGSIPPPNVGAKDGGYTFLGGDPHDQKNWKK